MERSQFKETLEFAIQQEQEAVDAYTAASVLVTQANIADMLRGLAEQEVGHKRRLMSIDLSGISDAHVRDIPDLRIAEYASDVDFAPTMDYQQVLTVAMKREETARNLYLHLASISDESELRELFEFLASEEAKHKLLLEKEYDENVLTQN